MIVLARVIAQGAKNRDESRGAHFKPEFPQRDDVNFMRTTMALHQGSSNGTPDSVKYVRALDYSLGGKPVHVTDEVDISLVKPRVRKYDTAGAASAVAGSDAASSRSAPAAPSTTAEKA
jgi:succinate dehydrogenase / fumarate reductase flavoprotein subunit